MYYMFFTASRDLIIRARTRIPTLSSNAHAQQYYYSNFVKVYINLLNS